MRIPGGEEEGVFRDEREKEREVSRQILADVFYVGFPLAVATALLLVYRCALREVFSVQTGVNVQCAVKRFSVGGRPIRLSHSDKCSDRGQCEPSNRHRTRRSQPWCRDMKGSDLCGRSHRRSGYPVCPLFVSVLIWCGPCHRIGYPPVHHQEMRAGG